MSGALMELMKEEIEARETKVKDQINALNICLINENRLEDLKRAASDKEYQKKLLAELKLLDK